MLAGVDFMFARDTRHEGMIPDGSLIKGNIRIERLTMAAGEIVENDDGFAFGL